MTGLSTRFTAAGYDRPKFALEAEGQLVIDHVIDMYPGWDDVVFVCNGIHLDDERLNLSNHLLRRRPNARIVRVDGECKGPGEAVLRATEFIDLDRPVVVNYCDFAVYWDVNDLLSILAMPDVVGVIPVYTGFHPHTVFSTSYAYVRMEGGTAVDIQEKQPWTDNPTSELASTGTYAFATGKILIDALQRQVRAGLTLNDEYYLSLTYKPLFDDGSRIEVMLVQHFMQWGTPQDFEEYLDVSRNLQRWVCELDPPASDGTSRVLLASGAGARFAREGYQIPKPLLPISGKTVMEHVLQGVPGSETVVVTRADLPQNDVVEAVSARHGLGVRRLSGLSRGQAESALRGLEALPDNNPVTVAACDALTVVSPGAFSSALEAIGTTGVGIWTAPLYSAALRAPEQYSWASMNAAGAIESIWLKTDPIRPDARVMIGTFTFGSRDAAIAEVTDLIEDGETLSGEFYLDSVAARMLARSRKVVSLATSSYLSVGTPAEYETVLYWQSCFHKWVHHRYSLSADRHVDAHARAAIDSDFRDFSPYHRREPSP